MESNCFASGLWTGERQTDRQTDWQVGRGTNLNLILPSAEILTETKVVINTPAITKLPHRKQNNISFLKMNTYCQNKTEREKMKLLSLTKSKTHATFGLLTQLDWNDCYYSTLLSRERWWYIIAPVCITIINRALTYHHSVSHHCGGPALSALAR